MHASGSFDFVGDGGGCFVVVAAAVVGGVFFSFLPGLEDGGVHIVLLPATFLVVLLRRRQFSERKLLAIPRNGSILTIWMTWITVP